MVDYHWSVVGNSKKEGKFRKCRKFSWVFGSCFVNNYRSLNWTDTEPKTIGPWLLLSVLLAGLKYFKNSVILHIIDWCWKIRKMNLTMFENKQQTQWNIHTTTSRWFFCPFFVLNILSFHNDKCLFVNHKFIWAYKNIKDMLKSLKYIRKIYKNLNKMIQWTVVQMSDEAQGPLGFFFFVIRFQWSFKAIEHHLSAVYTLHNNLPCHIPHSRIDLVKDNKTLTLSCKILLASMIFKSQN